MEEALRQVKLLILGELRIGFNPCFNGRGVKTKKKMKVFGLYACFNPCFNGRGVKT